MAFNPSRVEGTFLPPLSHQLMNPSFSLNPSVLPLSQPPVASPLSVLLDHFSPVPVRALAFFLLIFFLSFFFLSLSLSLSLSLLPLCPVWSVSQDTVCTSGVSPTLASFFSRSWARVTSSTSSSLSYLITLLLLLQGEREREIEVGWGPSGGWNFVF